MPAFSLPTFRNTVLLIGIAECLSFFAFLVPQVSVVFYLLILLLVLLISCIDLKYGLFVAIAEMFIGSKGHLFSIDLFGFPVSIRMGIFFVLMTVFVIQWMRRGGKILPENDMMKRLFLLVGVFYVIGIIVGALTNPLSLVFADMNGYLYGALLPVVVLVLKDHRVFPLLWSVMMGALVAGVIKIGLLVYFFSHAFADFLPLLYRWIRVTGVGEITWFAQGGYRIFFQSQLYHLLFWFILLFLILYVWKKRQAFSRELYWYSLLMTGLTMSLVLSLSRSFWVGGAVGILIAVLILARAFSFSFKDLGKGALLTFGLTISSLILIFALVFFPVPMGEGGFSLDVLRDRVDPFASDAAVSSRWELLPVLTEALFSHGLLGAGFGETVTYNTHDPRALEQTGGKPYTTYAFEWGYLDIWLKMGLGGLISYVMLLCVIGGQLFQKMRTHRSILYAGFFLGVIVLSVVSFFSPYLNHPLGILFLLLLLGILEGQRQINACYLQA